MKQFSFVVLFVLASRISQAQTFDEWLRQKATQKKYLIQQIAALKVYLDYVQKGYAIAQKGLTAISNSKQGDFDLHRDFIGSLKGINPKIKGYVKVADIVALQLKIVRLYKEVRRQVKKENLFGEKEVNYTFKVFENVLNDCSEIFTDLTAVITSNELEMKDDERLKRIDALYSGIQDNYVFAQGFGTEIRLLCLQRKKELADVQTSRALNDLENE
jgi:hypothetical protein